MPQSKNRRSLVRMGWVPVFITTNSPLGMDFNSSGVMSGRSIICKDWLLSLPWLTEPESTVRLPRAAERASAVLLWGEKPPKIVSWQLSHIISAPSFP